MTLISSFYDEFEFFIEMHCEMSVCIVAKLLKIKQKYFPQAQIELG